NEDSIQAHVRKEVKIKDGTIRRLEKIVTDKNNKIGRLEKLAKQLKSIRKMEVSGRVVPVKILDSFTRVDISRTHQKFRIKKGDVLYIKDASGGGVHAAEMIAELEVRAIIIGDTDTSAALGEKEGMEERREEDKKIGVAVEMSHTASNHLLLRGIPVLTTSDVPVRIFDDIGTVLPAKLDDAIDSWNIFMEEIRRKRKVEEIQSLVNEYRQERIKALRR
ncbi:MAG: hypothetical protein KAH86_05480, partial [Methanosarcinales archaeon]|nr:hypothetical protein [Methanosarcinales archaeon]